MIIYLEENDFSDLKSAVSLLEQSTITDKMTKIVGKPVEYLLKKLPNKAETTIHSIVEKSLHKAVDVAFWSLDSNHEKEPSRKTNKLFAAVSGAVGGAFGISALAIELPVSTTIMLRAIADIARSEGFDLESLETKTFCLEVFTLGGEGESKDSTETSYYAARYLTSEVVEGLSKELITLAAKQTASQVAKETANQVAKETANQVAKETAKKTAKITTKEASSLLASIIEKVATRYGIVITDKMVAQSIPIIGAVTGALINTMFTDFYQDMARGHFIVKRLENKYGVEIVKEEYEKLASLASEKLLPSVGRKDA